MNSFLKVTILILASTQVFAAQYDLNQMKNEIRLIKDRWEKECQPSSFERSNLLLVESSEKCQSEMKEVQKGVCRQKKQLIAYFEAITSESNINVVSKRFVVKPEPAALGGVLTWQMKNSVDQVNHVWSREVDKMGAKAKACVAGDLKNELSRKTNYVKNSIGQTSLSVRVAQVGELSQ